MDAARKIHSLLILSYWLCNAILLVEGKKYPCVLKEKVPLEEFGSEHYGELGFLRNVIVDVAGFLHSQMKLETPLRLCKLLSEVKTSYWDYFRVAWKKKTRDKFTTEFNFLERKAERVLDDLIKDARLTPEFPREDQDALAKIIDVAKDRLLNSKTYTNEDGLLLSYLNRLRSTYCPKIPGTFPLNRKPPESPSTNFGFDRYAKPPVFGTSNTMAVAPSTTENLVVHPPATKNVPFEPSAAGLPKRPLPPLQNEPSQAAVPSDLSQTVSSGPSSQSGLEKFPKIPLTGSSWHKPMPQPNQAIPSAGSWAPAAQPKPEAKCKGKECKAIVVDPQGNYIRDADEDPSGMAALDPSSASQNNHAHTPVKSNAVPGAAGNVMTAPTAQPSPVANSNPGNGYFYNPDILRKFNVPEDEIKRLMDSQKAAQDGAAAAAAQNSAPKPISPSYSAPSKANVNQAKTLPSGSMSSDQLRALIQKEKSTNGIKTGRKKSDKNLRPLTASDPIQDIVDPSQFEAKVFGANKPVFVQFHADYCGPCKFMTPALEKIIKEKEGRAYLVRVDAEKDGGISDEYDVPSLPNIKVFDGGNKIRDEVGYTNEEELRKFVNGVCR